MTDKKKVSKEMIAPEKPETTNEQVAAAKEYPFATLTCTLPSEGKIYDASHPFHMRDKIELKYLTAKEEDILTSPQLLRSGQAVNKVVESCVLEKVDIGSLLVGDRNAILLALRVSGYGAEYKVTMTSEVTGQQYEHEFDLNECQLKMLDAKPSMEGANLFDYTLPQTGQQVSFSLMTVNDEIVLQKELDRLSKALKVDKNVTTRFQKQIKSVGENTDGMFVKSFVENMPVRDSRALREYMNDIRPDTDMNVWITDPTSGEEVEVDIPIGPSFLWPSGRG